MKAEILRLWKTHDKLVNKIEYPVPVSIRMGDGYSKSKYKNPRKINDYDSICLCCDKYEVKRIWNEANINTPMGYRYTDGVFYSLTGDRVPNERFLERSKVAKLKTNRRYGKGMVLIENNEELGKFLEKNKKSLNKYYFEDMYPYLREFRVHCSLLGIIHVAQKLKEEEHEDSDIFDSNHIDFTTKFAKWKFPFKRIEKECIKALKLIGLDYGGFDVRVNRIGQLFKIIEVNSAPSLSETSANKLIKHIPKLLNYKYKQKHELL